MPYYREIIRFLKMEPLHMLGFVASCFQPFGQNHGHVLVQQELHSAAAIIL